MSTPIPSNIAEIIERKRQILFEENMAKEAADLRQREEAEMQGKVKLNLWLDDALLKTPEWIRPYLDREREVDYVRIASGWDRVENRHLYFTIPGLAIIEFDPKENNWRCESAGWNRSYDNDEPYLHFTNSSYWRTDLEFVLAQAQQNMQEHENDLEEYAAEQEERARQAERRLQENSEYVAVENIAQIRNELKRAEEKAEEEQLFDAIKNDPVAIHMLRAFVLVRDERSAFEARLAEADDSLSSMEGFWSNKAAELRRQADDAQRRAEDEKYRLQGDLDDAEAKLKKAQRGW